MDEAMIAQVRRFNRTVTERVGALDEHYLARARPLGAARLLWEIGPDGCDVRSLRARLALDSGYVSRLLRSLEADGLITVGRSEADGRVRVARLTRKGRAERAVLDRRSDAFAGELLGRLSGTQRDRLVAAMGEVERLLTAATVEVAVVDPEDPDAARCLQRYFAEIDRRFETGFDASRGLPLDAEHMRPPAGLLLMASLRAEPVGCGALKLNVPGVGEIKRMWVAESARGLGIGRRLLGELERRAAEAGATTVRLETNRVLTEAIAMYRSAGYTEVEPFNTEFHAHHWFEKRLPEQPG